MNEERNKKKIEEKPKREKMVIRERMHVIYDNE